MEGCTNRNHEQQRSLAMLHTQTFGYQVFLDYFQPTTPPRMMKYNVHVQVRSVVRTIKWLPTKVSCSIGTNMQTQTADSIIHLAETGELQFLRTRACGPPIYAAT